MSPKNNHSKEENVSNVSPMIQAQQTFLDAIPIRVTGIEYVDLAASRARVACADIVAPHAMPPYPRAIVEGYFARTEDTADASEERPVVLSIVGRVKPGDETCPTLKKGEVVEVATGSLVHSGEFSIVRAWEAERDGTTIKVKRKFPPGFFIEEQGCEFREGQTILPAGARLGPKEIGILASFGITTIAVARRPRVAVFSSGDEVVPYTQHARPGQIRDCNGIMLCAAIEEAGGAARFSGIMGDDFNRFVAALSQELPKVDAIVISGGTAVGGVDFISNLIKTLGKICVDGVPMKSGRPLIMGMIDNKPIICLAGHPPEALRGFKLFGVPALARLLGYPIDLPTDAQ